MLRYLSLVTCFVLVCMTSQAQALEVSVTDAHFSKGQSKSVTVKFKANPLKDVYAVDIAFDFDANTFKLDRIEKGQSVPGFQLVENRKDAPDRAKIALIGLFPLNAVEGDLITLHFTVRDDAQRSRDNALNISEVKFSTDHTSLVAEKITQGELNFSR